MDAPFRVLIADDEPELRAAIRAEIPSSHLVDEAQDGQEALSKFQEHLHDLVLLDVRMPNKSGLEVLKYIKQEHPSTTVVMITAHANIQDAVSAVQTGAFDYLEKPVKKERLQEILGQVFQARNLVKAVSFSNPQGTSKQMQRVFDLIDRLAKVNTSVFIRGENGTGKELVARAIHFNSSRKNKPFVAINCGALSEAEIESEFFGHEKDAFQGADSRKIGLFQYASGGTLFLDEVADLPLSAQAKLLRVIQDQKVTPVGSHREFTVDVRTIVATHRDIEKLISTERFRSDLFYKLNVMPVTLPPLRERIEDLPKLAQHFIRLFDDKHRKKIEGLSEDALNKLKKYSWPGNIRELETCIEHAFVLAPGTQIETSHLPDHILEEVRDQEDGWKLPFQKTPAEMSGGASFQLDYQRAKEEFEKQFIISALKQNSGKINQTCEQANIPKNTLLRKIKKYSIQAKDPDASQT